MKCLCSHRYSAHVLTCTCHTQAHMYTHMHILRKRHVDAHTHAHIRRQTRRHTHTHAHTPKSCLTQAVASPPSGPEAAGRPAPAGGVLPTQRHLQSTLLPLLREESAGRSVSLFLTTATEI